MTAAAVQTLQTLPITLKALRALLMERGLKLQVATRNEVVARWTVNLARVAIDGAHATVLRRNEHGAWRGVVLVKDGKGWDLVAQETRFRDLLHVGLFLSLHAPDSVR